MVDKAYRDLTATEKAKTLLIGGGLFAFIHDEPETAIDTEGISSPVMCRHGIEIKNDEAFDLYIKVVATVTSGDDGKYTNLVQELGLIAASGQSILWWTPTREIPSSLTVETMNIELRAYRDSAYTDFYGDSSYTWTFYFFDHSWALAVIIDEDDFEATVEGWAKVGYDKLEASPFHPYKGSQSLRFGKIGYSPATWEYDVSGQPVPKKTFQAYKNFTVGAYSYAFAVVHLTYVGYGNKSAVRIHYNTKDYICRTNIPNATEQFWRCAVLFPVNATTTLRISLRVQNQSIGDAGLDDIIVVAFA